MKLIEIDDIFNPDNMENIFPITNPLDPIQNTTQYNFKNIPILLKLVNDTIDYIINNNINYGFTRQQLLDRAEVQGQNYTGDIFVFHYDSYNEDDRVFEPYGQRIITGLAYCNANFEGGFTHFPKIDKYIIPKKGKMVLFTNVNDDLTLDHFSIHRATEVINGRKSIFNVWFREKPTGIKLTED